MATQSLYRRYRPRRFSEVKGQEHVVKALRTAVAEGREGQAYLFSGPRGTGKTSSARILAKVLNCENPHDGEPCCECESCLAVERGISYDVHELDAASNNGVDAMRDLIEKASLGTPGRHKVYILDEVHMLSKAAEAALLKTLEEPPPHVVFVLATTDPQKMSDTIRSRTQHLQFHLLAADTLQEHARWVAADAGLDVSDAALEQALLRGGGSARDTLSALELVATTGEDGLSVVALDEYVEAMIDRDPGRALTVVAHAITAGTDTRTLTEELVGFFRNGFLALMAPDLVQLPSARVDELAALAQRLGAAGLVRGIETLGSMLAEMRHAPDPRVLLDVATVQLTADAAATDVDALAARLDRLERQVASGPLPPSAPAAAPTPVDPATGRAALGGRARAAAARATESQAADSQAVTASSTASSVDDSRATAARVDDSQTSVARVDDDQAVTAPSAAGPVAITADVWAGTIRPSLRGMARAVFAPVELAEATVSHVTLRVPSTMPRAKCEEHRPTVEAALSDFAGASVSVELIGDDDGPGGGIRDSSATGGEGIADTDVAPTAASAPAELPDDADVDLDDLVDAPPETVRSPIDRLAEAFPGSELIEEAG